jgi:hypothetical protein
MPHDDDDFVDPVPERLKLRGGQFVDIKRQLNHGESEDMYAVISPHGLQNRRVVRTAKIDAYLLSWSLTKKGVPVPMSLPTPDFSAQARLDTIRSLSQRRALEIYDAIQAHEVKLEAEADAKKKIQPGASGAATTSPSPSAADGPSASDKSEP